MATDPEGSLNADLAKHYREFFSRNGIDLKLVPLTGAVESSAARPEIRRQHCHYSERDHNSARLTSLSLSGNLILRTDLVLSARPRIGKARSTAGSPPLHRPRRQCFPYVLRGVFRPRRHHRPEIRHPASVHSSGDDPKASQRRTRWRGLARYLG